MAMLKPRTARVVIYQGDDLARLSVLDAAVERAQKALDRAMKDRRPRLMHEEDPALVAAGDLEAATEARDAFAAEAEPRGVAVAMHAQPRKRWRELMSEHGPRDGDERDAILGVPACLDAQARQQLQRGVDVIELGNIGQRQRVAAQQAGAQYGQGGVFGARDGDFPVQRFATRNAKPIHYLRALYSSGVSVFMDSA